jgi:hypothetical protein
MPDRDPGLQHLLEVVQYEQKLPASQILLERVLERDIPALLQAERTRDLSKEEVGIGYSSEGHEVDTVLEVLQEVCGGLQGEPGLASAARPRQREQTYLFLPQPPADLLHLALPADQRRGL